MALEVHKQIYTHLALAVHEHLAILQNFPDADTKVLNVRRLKPKVVPNDGYSTVARQCKACFERKKYSAFPNVPTVLMKKTSVEMTERFFVNVLVGKCDTCEAIQVETVRSEPPLEEE